MWPFKKKAKQLNIGAEKFTSVICIPGAWGDFEEFRNSLIVNNEAEYMLVGNILLNAKRECHCEFEFCARDEKMGQAFKYAGMVTRIGESCLEQVEKHKFVVYLSAPTGSLEEAHNIALAAAAILKAGGLGVKVETAGKAFEKEKWVGYLENFDVANLYQMFVIDSITNEDGTVFSCGMQNLGYKDTIISGEDFQEAVALIKLFMIYQIVDNAIIKHNQTFSPDAESFRYRITDEKNPPYKGQELFGNPDGMWRLARMKE